MSVSGPTLWGQLPFDVLSRIIKQSVGAKECHKNKMNLVLSELLRGVMFAAARRTAVAGLLHELLTLLKSHIDPDRWDTRVALCEIIERIEVEAEIDQDGDGLDILRYTPPNLTIEPLQPGWELDDDLNVFVWDTGFLPGDRDAVVGELYDRLQRELA